jgi:nitrile hydratase
VVRVLTRGSFEQAPAAPPRFAPGDEVRTRNIHPSTHTRLPRYVRGHHGLIERVQGCHLFPDASALGREEAHWLYTVSFEARELWGDEADPRQTVSVEAFEPYLEPH